MSQFETVIYETYGSVAKISMNRPARRNALNDTLIQDLQQAFEDASDDPAVRAIVLAGAGKGFCAGADLSVFKESPTPDQVYATIINNYQPLVGLITRVKKPVIAAVNGTAAGAGASLALACDLRVMADDGSIMMAFSNIGLVPDAGATWLLVRQVGYARAYEIAIEGQKIPADRCLEWGLANKLAPAASLADVSLAWAMKLAKRPTLALGLTKLAMGHAALNGVESTIEYEARLQKQTITSHDHVEGVTAFLQKREPEYKGN
jgi:2-(1,2-epoxy-1,2-dihydrophenyl)acetyl-CoA isomerase